MRPIAGEFPHAGVRMKRRIRNQFDRWRVNRQPHYESDRERRVEMSYALIAPEKRSERRVEGSKEQGNERADSVVWASVK